MPLINTADVHSVKVKKASIGENPEKGTPFVELQFINAAGETINGWLYLSDAAFERSVRVLREVFGFNNDFNTLPAQVENKECSITTEFDTYEGKERLKVKWINSASRAAAPLKDASAISRFSQMAARIPAEAPKAATKAPAATKAEPKADDDFPTGKGPF